MDELETGELNEPPAAGADLTSLRERLAEHEARERAALSRLQEALLASDPAIDPELVHGETLEEVERSFGAAKAMADRVRESVRREQSGVIPAGGAARASRVPQSAIEKIRAGLGGR
jgi:hypothetical protein